MRIYTCRGKLPAKNKIPSTKGKIAAGIRKQDKKPSKCIVYKVR